MKQSNKNHTLRNAKKWLGHLCTFDGKADDHNFFFKNMKKFDQNSISSSCCFSKIPLQEVAILKQTMFRKAECGEKSKNNKLKTRRDPISFALCFQLWRSSDFWLKLSEKIKSYLKLATLKTGNHYSKLQLYKLDIRNILFVISIHQSTISFCRNIYLLIVSPIMRSSNLFLSLEWASKCISHRY